jgi:NAD(P)-dependent dehydrogenase (short-subunit alcohol dehydrogenase family)
VKSMEINLTGKNAIISGSTTGIGYAIAVGMAKAGATVVINGRTEKRVVDAIERLKAEVPGAEVKGVAADLSSAAGVNQMIAHCPHADILVNNLGIYGPKPFFDITDEDWEYYFQVNVMSAVRLSRHYARGMVDRGWGRVLFNASVTSGFFSGEMVHYGATKGALISLARGLAESVAGAGVTVNSFIPGPTLTENVKEHIQGFANQSGKTFAETEAEIFHSKLPTSIIKRFVSPEEVANLVVFLASDQASAITGAAMKVDGGIVCSLL